MGRQHSSRCLNSEGWGLVAGVKMKVGAGWAVPLAQRAWQAPEEQVPLAAVNSQMKVGPWGQRTWHSAHGRHQKSRHHSPQ